jgi:hypothetical protein
MLPATCSNGSPCPTTPKGGNASDLRFFLEAALMAIFMVWLHSYRLPGDTTCTTYLQPRAPPEVTTALPCGMLPCARHCCLMVRPPSATMALERSPTSSSFTFAGFTIASVHYFKKLLSNAKAELNVQYMYCTAVLSLSFFFTTTILYSYVKIFIKYVPHA